MLTPSTPRRARESPQPTKEPIIGKHRAPTHTRRNLLVATALAAIASVLLTAAPAHADPVNPRRGEGIASMTARTCGAGTDWRAVAAANGIKGPRYTVYLGRTYDVDCSTPRAHATERASRSTTRTGTGVQAVIDFAMAQRGKPYRWGADGPGGYDCSGLVVASYRQIGVSLPHFTGALLGRGQRVARADLRPGDLVFPSRSHVGIYIGGNQMVVAPRPGTSVRVQTVYAFYTARRVA